MAVHVKKIHWALGMGVVLYTGLFFLLSILRYKTFFSYEWEDVAEANRLYWNISQGHAIEYFKFMFSDGKYYLVHIVPIYFLISIAYFIVPHLYTTFFIVNFSLAVAAVPIYGIAKEVLKDRTVAFILALSYLLYAPKHSLNFLDGDPSIYSIPLILFAFYAVLLGKKRWFILCSVLVILCKTETPMYVAVFSMYLYLRKKTFVKIDPKVYLVMFLISLFFFGINIFLFKLLSQDPICYACKEQSFFGTLRFIFSNPTLQFMTEAQWQGLFKLFWPVFFVPLLTPEIILAVPTVFFIIATDDFVFQRAHYISSSIPAIFIGVIYFIKRIQPFFRKNIYTAFVVMILIGCFLSNLTPNIIGGASTISEETVKDTRFMHIKNIYDKQFYVMDEDDKIAWEMVNLIPKDPNVSVSASGDMLIPLSSRKRIIEFLDEDRDYHNVDYILIHNKYMFMGAGHYFWDDKKAQEEISNLFNDDNWNLQAHKGDFYLFKKSKSYEKK